MISFEMTLLTTEKMFPIITSLDSWNDYLEMLETLGWPRQKFMSELEKRIAKDWEEDLRCIN